MTARSLPLHEALHRPSRGMGTTHEVRMPVRRPPAFRTLLLVFIVGLGLTASAGASPVPVPAATVAPPLADSSFEAASRTAQASAPTVVRLQAPVPMSIYVDGSTMAAGVTPLELTSLVPGAHRFVAKAQGYRDYPFFLALEGGRVTRAMLNPQSSATRVGVQIEARGHREEVWQNFNRYEYYLEWNRGALFAQFQSKLSQVPGFQAVEGGAADLVVRAEFTGDRREVQGTLTLVNAQGVVLGCESQSIGMPVFSDSNLTGAATKRANQIIERVLPKMLQKLSQNNPLGPVPPPTVSVE